MIVVLFYFAANRIVWYNTPGNKTREKYMKIAIDLDGVIFDTENYFRTNAQFYDLKNGGEGEVKREELWAQNRYTWTREQYDEFFGLCLENILKNAPMMVNAGVVIRALAKKHELYVITNRGDMHKSEIDITYDRLKRDNIDVFTKVYFHDEYSKLDRCRQEGVELMIDDLYNNVASISGAGIKCLYYRDLVQKSIDSPLVYEVRNWGDIARYLVDNHIIDVEDLDVDLTMSMKK